MARINDCASASDWRTARDVPVARGRPRRGAGVVLRGRRAPTTGALTERERLAAEFARRYAVDHRSMDAAFWARCHDAYTDDELVDLALCVGSWLALGRFNQVFDIDGACRVPAVHGASATPGLRGLRWRR